MPPTPNTGSRTQAEMQEALQAGMDAYLTKPLDTSQLADVVADLVRAR